METPGAFRLKGDLMIQYLNPATLQALSDAINLLVILIFGIPFITLLVILWGKRL